MKNKIEADINLAMNYVMFKTFSNIHLAFSSNNEDIHCISPGVPNSGYIIKARRRIR